MSGSKQQGKLPLVSIIIPTYNHRHLIDKAIDSALAQTYPNCEIIVIDDGSTDGTDKFLKDRYGGEIIYKYQQNQGRSAARNCGLSLANGDYIQFLDSDDQLMKEKIERHVTFLEKNPDYAAVYGHCLVYTEGDYGNFSDYPMQFAYCSGDILKQEIHKPFLLLIMVLVRKDWIIQAGCFDISLRSNEDWDLWLRIAFYGGKFCFIPGPPVGIYMYQKTRREYNNVASIHMFSGIQVLQKLKCSIRELKISDGLDIDRAIGDWTFGYGIFLAREGKRLAGIFHMLKSLTKDHRSIVYKSLVLLTFSFMPISSADNLVAVITKYWRIVRNFITRRTPEE